MRRYLGDAPMCPIGNLGRAVPPRVYRVDGVSAGVRARRTALFAARRPAAGLMSRPRTLGDVLYTGSGGVGGVGDYPTPDLTQGESVSRSTPEKSVSFGPDGAASP